MEEASQAASNINPFAALFLLAMGVVLLCGSRKRAAQAVLVTAAFIPLGQELVIGGLHLYFLRILVLVGWVRVWRTGEASQLTLEGLDRLFIGWVFTGVVCGVLRGPSAETFGVAYDSLGIYFLLRCLTRDWADVLAHLQLLCWVAIVMALCMIWESATDRNVFHVLGGVPKVASFRYERFRAQGPFRHAILAGTFGATLFPMLVSLRLSRCSLKRLSLMGAVSCAVITVVSASSGPLLSFLVGVLGLSLWRMRERLKVIRYLLVFGVLGLALVMKAPVWFLIGRVSEVTGGTGWYRSFLIDQALRHINEWWLIGTSVTAHWASPQNISPTEPNNMDITNHYIVQGINGGVLMLGLFIIIIVVCYRRIGWSVRHAARLEIPGKAAWGIGVALTTHCVSFISVSYFDQIKVFWFWLLAVVAAVSVKPQTTFSEVLPGPTSSENERPPQCVSSF